MLEFRQNLVEREKKLAEEQALINKKICFVREILALWDEEVAISTPIPREVIPRLSHPRKITVRPSKPKHPPRKRGPKFRGETRICQQCSQSFYLRPSFAKMPGVFKFCSRKCYVASGEHRINGSKRYTTVGSGS